MCISSCTISNQISTPRNSVWEFHLLHTLTKVHWSYCFLFVPINTSNSWEVLKIPSKLSFFFSVNSHKKNNQIKHAWLNFFLIHFISWAFYEAFCVLHSKVASYIFAKVLQPCLAKNYYSVQYGGRNKLWVFPKMITNVYIYFLTALQCCFTVSRSCGPLLCIWACFMNQLACKQNHQHTAGHIPTASKTLASLSIFYFLCPPPIWSTLLPFEKNKMWQIKN